jgi:hypothetical protein
LYFTVNPVGQTDYVLYGMSNSVSLFATAYSSQSLNYQWYHVSADGLTTNAVSGATNTFLTVVNPSVSDGGYYYLNASNSLGSTNSIPAVVQMIPRPGLTTVNGDFEIPYLGTGQVNGGNGVGVAYWYAPTASYEAWVKSADSFDSDSQACVFAPTAHSGAVAGWIYQALGTYNATNGTNLNWTFEQVTDVPELGANNSADFTISVYYTIGSAFTPAQGTDIYGAAGVTQIGSYSFDSLNVAGLTNRVNTGSQDLSNVPNGATIWVRVANTGTDGSGNGFASIDNVFVSQIPTKVSINSTSAGQLQLEWNYYYGTLLSATNVRGPWMPVPGATSPFIVIPLPTTLARFYRVQIP